jgi:riboflavin synthase
MFTGIVEERGSVIRRDGPKLRIGASLVLDDVQLGASIAVSGCCLTVVDWGGDSSDLGGTAACDKPSWFEVDVTEESYARTSLGALHTGDGVNLERPVRLQDRLGGHLVQGHVDGVGTIVEPAPNLRIATPDGLARYIVEKGSITVDGVSLTIVDALDDAFTVAVIPHTSEVTTLGAKQPGDPVNLEVDVTAKYVERLLTWRERS